MHRRTRRQRNRADLEGAAGRHTGQGARQGMAVAADCSMTACTPRSARSVTPRTSQKDQLGGSAQPLARGQHPDYWHYVMYDGVGYARGLKRPRRETGLVLHPADDWILPHQLLRDRRRGHRGSTWAGSKSRKSSLPSAKPAGNDLSTPVPEIGFPGLQSLVPVRHALEGGARC